MKGLIVAGIGTEVGKTLVASILVEAIQADYWKPVQAGNLASTDTDFVRKHVSPKLICHPEAYRLREPMSPHAAAKKDNVQINFDNLSLPDTSNALIIELAGGLLVPLNERQLNIDLLLHWKLPVVLVSQHYLGSINHTLLAVEALKVRKIDLKAIVFNGDRNRASEEIILSHAGVKCLTRIGHEPLILKPMIRQYADGIRFQAKKLLQ